MDVSHSWRGGRRTQMHIEHQYRTGCHPNSARSLSGNYIYISWVTKAMLFVSSQPLVGICSDHKVHRQSQSL